MGYDVAVNTLLDSNSISAFLLVLIALLVLFLLAGQGVKMWRDLFGKPKADEDAAYKKHCEDSEKRFKADERHIAENRDDIRDLKEGLRVSCLANMALLNHAIHNGNTDEMKHASGELNKYLINRK